LKVKSFLLFASDFYVIISICHELNKLSLLFYIHFVLSSVPWLQKFV